jgi:Holliday junction resolvase-like predicted endonuclease
MNRIGLWDLENGKPLRLKESSIQFERNLEDWIVNDPNFLREGLTIIGRQLKVSGGIIDLLAVDPNGRLIIIEIKRGMLRRKTIAQIIDYAASIDLMPEEELKKKINDYLDSQKISLKEIFKNINIDDVLNKETRDILLFVVGSTKEPGLERMIVYLSDKFNMPISTITFDIFSQANGAQIIAREVSEPFENLKTISNNNIFEDLKQYSKQVNTYEVIKSLIIFADNNNVFARFYKKSIMITPPNNRTRMLFTVWAKPANNKIKIYFSPKAISEFYPIDEQEIIDQGFKDGYRDLDLINVDSFISKTQKLFDLISKKEVETDDE